MTFGFVNALGVSWLPTAVGWVKRGQYARFKAQTKVRGCCETLSPGAVGEVV